MKDEEIRELQDKWLQVCGQCDAGQPMNCTCPDEDHRPLIAKLLSEVDELQQTARKSFGDLQQEYMALEVKYHELMKRYDALDSDREGYHLEALTWEHQVRQVTKERDSLQERHDMEIGGWEHRVRQLNNERDNLFALNKILEADNMLLAKENQELRNG